MNKILNSPVNDRPYEKCENYGAEALSDTELLAVIMRTGTVGVNAMELSEKILTSAGRNGSFSSLDEMSIEELLSIKGVGKVKAIQIKCLTEFSKRLWRQKHSKRSYRSPDEIAAYYMEHMRYLPREEVHIMMLDNKCAFIGDFRLSLGTVDCSLISVRDIFMNSLKRGAVRIVMIHNHPSGDPAPSREDIAAAKKVYEAGRLLDISLIDSIIIGDGKYVSLFNETDVFKT